MKISLYRNNSEPERAKKSVTLIKTVEARLLSQDTEIMNPELELAGNFPKEVNYFLIPAWNRWYYATEMSQLANGMWKLTGHVDVLESFRDYGLMQCQGIAARNGERYNLYMQDTEVQSYQNPLISTKAFPKGFKQGDVSYVLVVAGN